MALTHRNDGSITLSDRLHVVSTSTVTFDIDTGLLTPPSTPPSAPQTKAVNGSISRLETTDIKPTEATVAAVENVLVEYGSNAAFEFEYKTMLSLASPEIEPLLSEEAENHTSTSLRKQMFTSPRTLAVSQADRNASMYPGPFSSPHKSPRRNLAFGTHKQSSYSTSFGNSFKATRGSVNSHQVDAESCLQCVELGLGDTCSKSYPTCTRCLNSQHLMVLQGNLDASLSHPCLARTYGSGGGIVKLDCDTAEVWAMKQEMVGDIEEKKEQAVGKRDLAPSLHRSEVGRTGWIGCFDIFEE